jgi:hypothetical protein
MWEKPKWLMGEEAAIPLNMVIVLDFEYRNSWKF